MFKLRIRFEDCSIVGEDRRDFFGTDKVTGLPVRHGRTEFKISQVAGLLAVLVGERPISAKRALWAKDYWQSNDVGEGLRRLASAAVIEVTEERCEMFFARKSAQTDYPSCNIDSHNSTLRHGAAFVAALKRLLPDVRTHGERVRMIAESCKGDGRFPPSIYEAARILDDEQVKKEMTNGTRKKQESAWCIAHSYMGGNNFRPKQFVSIEVNGNPENVSSCGGPAVRLVRSGIIHLLVTEADAAWLARKIPMGASTATFGEGGLAWIESPPTDPSDYETWDLPKGYKTVP